MMAEDLLSLVVDHVDITENDSSTISRQGHT